MKPGPRGICSNSWAPQCPALLLQEVGINCVGRGTCSSFGPLCVCTHGWFWGTSSAPCTWRTVGSPGKTQSPEVWESEQDLSAFGFPVPLGGGARVGIRLASPPGCGLLVFFSSASLPSDPYGKVVGQDCWVSHRTLKWDHGSNSS